jgi:isopenicillin-N N-acyltransferase-like protein
MKIKTISSRFFVKASLLILLMVAISTPEQSLYAQTSTAIKPGAVMLVPEVELKGNGYEKGFQHGRALKKEMAEVYTKWKLNIRNSIKRDPDSVLSDFLKVTNFEPVTRKYTPEILDELKGLSEGSGQKYSDVFAFQLVDEFWVYIDKLSNVKNHHCSGIGVPATANHPAYIAQNMDLENYMNGYQVLLHIAATEKEPEQYVLTCAGLVGMNGMNGNGIGVCVNTLMELQASTDGLPVAFIIRGMLHKENGTEAISFLTTVKHASGQNYIVGVVDSVYDFEASANQVIRFLPKGKQNSIVYHTNHALTNHDVKEWYKEYHQKILANDKMDDNSEIRYASLKQHLDKQPDEISTDVIKSTLRSKDNKLNPVCRAYKEGGGGFTFSSVVFTLGQKRSVQLTYGSPDQSEYKEYFFEKK